ncbi:Hypothetical_protein [Hexamita inflata]|uniref:Hypothetical_protein n=1 Tax=Hexamita inflata TaxID=28002 RepID=A0AA86NGM3_9EUKA|nr:Hypothetical protein HINF_LOCUS7212 [Hexamita inflata]
MICRQANMIYLTHVWSENTIKQIPGFCINMSNNIQFQLQFWKIFQNHFIFIFKKNKCYCDLIISYQQHLLGYVPHHKLNDTSSVLPALNLEALRVAADTLVPRFIPAIPKEVTKITSEVNNVSSSAELTQVV